MSVIKPEKNYIYEILLVSSITRVCLTSCYLLTFWISESELTVSRFTGYRCHDWWKKREVEVFESRRNKYINDTFEF